MWRSRSPERRWPEVLDWGERWVSVGHAPETGYRALMRAHAELGDRSRVAQVYQRCREALFDELGVEPSIQTRRLYDLLRRDDEEAAMAGHVRPAAQDEAPAPGIPPFQGLQYFAEADTERFFGREQLTARLVGRLRTEPFVALIGASGSGKSSAMRAGLVPALKHVPAGDRPGWDVRVFTPTAHPLDAMAASLVAGAAPTPERRGLLDELGRDPGGLYRFVTRKATTGQPRVVLIIDQSEELFTLCHDAFEREAFAENLLTAGEAGGRVAVVIALRADFYAHCAQYTRLREAVAQHQEYVGPMTAAELRRAIEGPAEQGRWGLEPGLVDLLLRDVGEEPGALALLSHALLETWQRRRGRRLTLAGYAAAGGIQGAIAQTAETVFTQRLRRDQQGIARRLFLRLTELGEGTQDTRRRAAIATLVGQPDAEPAVRAVLEMLADARLVTLGETTAEVAHEALIREWPRLREWLNQDRERLWLQPQLDRAAEEWERSGNDASAVYRGARLGQALDWAREQQDELGALSGAFLVASREAAEDEAVERERQRQRELEAAQQLAEAERRRADEQHRAAGKLRQRAVMLGLAFVLALVMAGTAVLFGGQAHEQTNLAQANARTALSRELAAAAISNLSIDPERAGLLALQAVGATYAVDRTWTPESEDALHRVLPLLRAQLTLAGHAGEVWGVAFSPDGQRLATASQDGTAKVWDVATGGEQLTLRGHTDSVNAVAFSPDGRLVATASDDHSAKVWDATTGQERLTLAGHGREVGRLAFNPTGTQLATTSEDGTLKLWDPLTGVNVLTFGQGGSGEFDFANDVAFSPDGGRLATVTPEGTVREWELSGGQPALIRTWPGQDNPVKHGVAFSPDGTRVAATTDGVRLWSGLTGELTVSAVGHTNEIYHVAFSPDGSRFATASLDRTAKVWDATSGRELLTLAGHQAAVNRVAFSPEGLQLATASWDGTATIWDLGPAHEALVVPSLGSGGRVAVSPDGSRLLAGLADGTGRVWDARTGQELLLLQGHTGRVWGTAVSADGTRLATGGADGTVRVWDAATGAMFQTLVGHASTVMGVAFSPDATRLASASDDKTARIWDVATGRALLTLSGAADPLESVSFSPDGTRVAASSLGPEAMVRMWDASSGALVVTLNGHQDTVWSVAFSPDGTHLATASRDGTARIWDATNGQQLGLLRGHAGTVVGATFSPDGQRIATAGRDGAVKVWEASTGRELLSLAGTNVGEGFDSVAFSPDGRRLIVGGDDAVRVYVLPIEDLMTLVRARLTRSWRVDECQRFLHQERCPN